ncbi:MAG: tRNA dihydrouridine synthase DusB [Clostridia bacterium]|jgi:tRNA-dihydrouridine synthase B|nr:tRNA dihydrouridine synthase DusB [Clostridiaceae bacterium]
MKIGSVEFQNHIFLAPMAGITDYAFRKLCKEQGAGLTYTEMISAKALCYKDRKTFEIAKIYPDEVPTAVQIFGSEPYYMAKAAEFLCEQGPCLIDINMGCPAPKIVKNGEGCALMKDLSLAGKIIAETVKASKVPVTVKIRKGWDENSVNAVEMAKTAEENGASAVTIHGRTRDMYYSGHADWEIIARVKESVSIPVIGNGDIKTAKDVMEIKKITGCDGVMIGRAALGNPWIFSWIGDEAVTDPPAIDPYRKYEMILRHMDLMLKIKGEVQTVNEMRKHIAWYLKGFKYAAKIRDSIFKIDDLEGVKKELERIFAKGGLEDA